MPKKLDVQQRQSTRVGGAEPVHQVPPDHVLKPKKLELQQRQRAHHGPSGHVRKLKKLGAQQW